MGPWALIRPKNIQNLSRFGWVMAIFPLRGCVIPLRTTWDIGGSLGVDLYQKDKKSVKKWLSYGYFPPERLCDSIENQMGQKGILRCSFVPKRSKIGQEMAELLLFFHLQVAWFHQEVFGTKGDPWAFICTRNIQNPSRNGWVKDIFPLRGCVIPKRALGRFSPWEVAWLNWLYWQPHVRKGDPLMFICAKMIQNLSRNG